MHRIPVKTTYKVQEPYPEQLTLTQLIDISQPPKEFKLTEVCWWIGRIGIVPQQWSAELVDWFLPKEYVCVRRLERGKQVAAEKADGWIEAADEKEIDREEVDEMVEEAEDNDLDQVLSQNFCICRNVFGDDSECYCGFEPAAKAETASSDEGHDDKRHDDKRRKCSEGSDNEKPKAAALKRKTEPKEFNISLTLGIACVDVPGEIFDKSQNYMEEKATMAIMAFERGDAHLLLHIQSMFTIKTTSTRKLKEDIRAAVGWKDTAPLGNSLCVRSLKEKGLHTTTGLIGYCLKDEREAHFRLYTKNITERQMEEDRRVHFIYGASKYKNKVQLTPTNVLARALQYRKYRTKSPISVSFRNYFKQMIRSGKYMPGLKWATMKPMSQLRVERICSHRMELLIAEARKRKDDDDHKGQEPEKAADADDEQEDGSKGNHADKAAHAHDGQEDRDPSEPVRANEPAVQQIHDDNRNLQQPRAPGSPDDEFDADELPDVVDLDDIIQPGMDAEVLMYDLLTAGYGVRQRQAAGPEEHRNDDNNDQHQAANAAKNVIAEF
ncbi:hypothetical protein R1sor_006439 [Riccia sorocarpa]|uniref:Replitron HUH endonuclease domain-containing protein n=1 Tax=Riccia sorocarpa TaxID=122646 RepID=A0ABD3HN12_9MARC